MALDVAPKQPSTSLQTTSSCAIHAFFASQSHLMPPKPNNPSSLRRSACKLKEKVIAAASSSTTTTTSATQGVALQQCAKPIHTPITDDVRQRLRSFMLPNKTSDSPSHLKATDVSLQTLNLHSSDDSEKSPSKLSWGFSSRIYGVDDSYDSSDKEDDVVGAFFHELFPRDNRDDAVPMHRKDKSRERKQKFIFNGRGNWPMTFCKMYGLDATRQILEKCKTKTGPTELNALVKWCVQAAREAEDEEAASSQIVHAFKFFELMIEQGYPIKEETYSPVLLYLIEARMVQEFQFLFDFKKLEISHHRLAYYELLLWMSLGDEDKIQELCYSLSLYDGEDKSLFQENYLLAFCKSGRSTEVLQLLRTFEITKVSSVERIKDIFRCLGKLLLESLAESFLVALKLNGIGSDRISEIIFDFVTGIPNLTVEDVILKCRNLHATLDVKPTSVHYKMLIRFCCRASQVHRALDIVDNMVEAGHSCCLKTFHFMLDSCMESCEYNLVRRIYSMMSLHGLELKVETFRIMITLIVKMRDYDGAYRMFVDMKTMNIKPTAPMYNAIMAGFFREKNLQGALRVLKQMEDEDLKPDSQTYSYLLSNCNCEEDIHKILDEMKCSEVQASKHVYMALVNAYATCGEFEKAKQVVLSVDVRVPQKHLNEIKSVLVSALASNGKMSDALNTYEEIKQSNLNLEQKAVICLIEHLRSSPDELNRLLQLLEELHDPDYWLDGCTRVISFCVHHEHLRPTVDLLKQLLNTAKNDEVPSENLFDGVFCQIAEKDSPDIHFGMNLLQAIKEELGVRPSRQSLDFLLTACLSAKDLSACFLVWKQYEAAGLPYNVLSYVRMYQALLALGDYKSAKSISEKIPKDDPHVSSIIKAYEEIYKTTSTQKDKKKTTTTTTKKKKKKKKEAKVKQ